MNYAHHYTGKSIYYLHGFMECHEWHKKCDYDTDYDYDNDNLDNNYYHYYF